MRIGNSVVVKRDFSGLLSAFEATQACVASL